MANNYKQAVQDLHRFAESFKGVLGLAEAMEGIESVEQATDEANARLDVVRIEEAELTGKVANAKGQAEKIVTDAKATAAKIKADAEAKRAVLDKEIADLNAEKTKAQEDLATIAKQRDEIRTRINQMREQLIV